MIYPIQSEDFISGLKKLRMLSEQNEVTGLLFVNESENKADISSTEWFALEKAKELGANAVYFRRFANRASIPQIYIYDFTLRGDTSELEHAEINKKIWSSSVVPLVYIFYKTSIIILDCTKPIKIVDDAITVSYLEKHLSLVGEINKKLEKYTADLFDNGLFWENQNKIGNFSFKNSAYEKLLLYLKHVRKEFVHKAKISDEVAQKLIVQSILIKYLEEREDSLGNKVFPQEYFNKYKNAQTFCDVLRNSGECLKLFDDLNENKFNGKIFEWAIDFERNEIKNKDLHVLADFFDADKTIHGQLSFWKQYSFSYLPVELISRIYEEFLGNNKDGLVYTPPHLVSFLIDECLPLNIDIDKINLDIKILDPACGSGIFLVSAFKRIVQLWRLKHKRRNPTIASLKKILKDCIYGVDIEEKAVQLTTFSLSLAICDLLSPTEIWHELKFDNLKEENIKADDFFNWKVINKNKKFDFIIGNPPFIRGGIKHDQYWEVEPNVKISIPQNEIALKFLSESMTLLKPMGLQCLIIKANNLFYNSSSLEFRTAFFNNYHVVQVLDFSSLARNHVLWDNAEVAAAAVFTKNQKPDFKKNVLHVTIRRTKAASERILFEIDDYDLHYIRRKLASESPYIWKSNLLGGGRTFDLVQRFNNIQTIKKFILTKQMISGEGFIVGTEGKKSPFFLTNMRTLPTNALTENGIKYSMLHKQTAKHFVKTSQEYLYKTPNILIKENIGENKIPLAFNQKEDFTFKDKIFAISADRSQTSVLKNLYSFINTSMDLFRFLIFAKSGQILLNKNTAFLKEDFMNLPVNKDFKDFKLSRIEKNIVADALDYYQEFIRHGDHSPVLKPIKNEAIIKNFCSEFVFALNSIYEEKEKKFFTKNVFFGDDFIATQFSYEKMEKVNEPEWHKFQTKFTAEYLNNVFSSKISETSITKRIIKLYTTNSVVLIKPNQLRFWLKSIAYRDADKVVADMAKKDY